MNLAFLSERVRAAAGLACLGLLFAVSAPAAEYYYGCSGDIAKFCKDVKADQQSILNCLEAHEAELSDLCKETESRLGGRRVEMMENAETAKMLRTACKADADKYCGNADAAPGGLEKCLRGHAKDLSESCSRWLKAADAEKYRYKAP